MRPVLRSALARLLSFIPAAIGTFATSRLVISHFGVAAFDGFSLIVTLLALIPLNNLGVGAAITSAYAAEGPATEAAYRVTLTAARVTALSSAGTGIVAALIAAVGAWPTLIGGAAGPNWWTGAAIILYALTFIPGLSTSMLLGVHRNHYIVYVQSAQAPLALLGALAVWWLRASGGALLLIPPAVVMLMNLTIAALASRATGIKWSRLMRDVVSRPSRRPGGSIRSISGPVLVTTLATPIALQLDRIVLSHVSSTAAVADYSVAIQIFAPAIALVAASGGPLWPIWQQARSEGRQGPSVVKVILLFVSGAAVVSAVLVLIANPAADIIGTGHIHLGILLPVAAGLNVVTSALAWPIAMNLMDPSGVRFTAACTAVMLPVNVGLSIYLASLLGASGPLLATVAVGIGGQCVPSLIYIHRRSSVGRHRSPRKQSGQPVWWSLAAPDSGPADVAVDVGDPLP